MWVNKQAFHLAQFAVDGGICCEILICIEFN